MKWLPNCGEVKLNPYPPGAKVNVITKGIIVTDTEGHLINDSPELTQTVCNLISNVWESRVIPDLKIKKESGISIPFPILSFKVLFDRINKKDIVL